VPPFTIDAVPLFTHYRSQSLFALATIFVLPAFSFAHLKAELTINPHNKGNRLMQHWHIVKKSTVSVLVAAMLLTQPTLTLAQNSSFAPMTWYQNGMMRQQTLNGWSAREKEREAEEQAAPTKQRKGVATSTFKPVAPDILPSILAKQQASTPEELRALERYYRTNLGFVERGYQQASAPAKDLAMALVTYLSLNYAVALDRQMPILNGDQNGRFYKNLREAVLRDPKIQALDDGERQMLYEELLLTGLSLLDAVDLSKQNNKPEAGRQARALARQNVEEFMGVPFARVKITPNGLEAQ
jgi:hypothetical protein